MTRLIADALLALDSSQAASILVKVSVTTGLALAGARLARGGRASVRHVLLTAAFGVLVALPIATVMGPSVPVEVPLVVQDAIVTSWPAPIVDVTPIAGQADAVASVPRTIHRRPRRPSISAIALTAWLAGAVLLLIPVVAGLCQVRSLRRGALPWPAGQAIVDRLALDAGIHRHVDALLHEALPGPMTCCFVRPAILLPVDAQSWNQEDVRRALVHELEHVRRGDWISQVIARALCACYWLHPFVWIAWRQLVLEAERACDDAVLRRAEATAYADQLVGLARRLSTARHQPRLAMANRADLTTRVAAVLDSRQPRGRAGRLSVLLVSAVSTLLVMMISPLRMVAAAPFSATRVALDRLSLAPAAVNKSLGASPDMLGPGETVDKSFAQAPAPVQKPASVARPTFEVASIKPCDSSSLPPGGRGGGAGPGASSPGRLSIRCQSVMGLINAAYVLFGDGQKDMFDVKIEGGRDWIGSERYDINATAPGEPGRGMMNGPMLQALLEDRFKLKIHREIREVPVYVLTVAKGGPRLQPFQEGSCVARLPPPGPQPELAPGQHRCALSGSLNGPNMVVDAEGRSVEDFARTFLRGLGASTRPVVDKTGIKGTFTFHLEYGMEEEFLRSLPPGRPGVVGQFSDDPPGPSVFTAVQEQLGLKLEPGKGPGEFLVIDSVERPSPD